MGAAAEVGCHQVPRAVTRKIITATTAARGVLRIMACPFIDVSDNISESATFGTVSGCWPSVALAATSALSRIRP